MSPVEAAAVAARLVQFAAAAVLGGASLFFLYGVMPDAAARWPSRLTGIAAAFGALATLGWLMAQAGTVAATAREALDPAAVWSIGAQTGFGRVALGRLAIFLLAAGLGLGRRRGRSHWLALAGLGAAASASFAWTGHGMRDEGWAGFLHLGADVAHLLGASAWIGALAALAVLVSIAGRSGAAGAARDAAAGLARFSGVGPAVVALLAASGLVNSWFLLGAGGLDAIVTTPYGRLLAAKLALFGLMLALAGANRYRLAPQLQQSLRAPGEASGAALGPVIASVLTETALAVAVLALVSWMGTLSPPIDASG